MKEDCTGVLSHISLLLLLFSPYDTQRQPLGAPMGRWCESDISSDTLDSRGSLFEGDKLKHYVWCTLCVRGDVFCRVDSSLFWGTPQNRGRWVFHF